MENKDMEMKGYEVVYYIGEYRVYAGNKETFPEKEIAERYKTHYENYPWFDHELIIEEVDYDGAPLGEYQIFNGKKVIDEAHYFGLACCIPGDYFTKSMVDNFMNMLPPAYMRNDCSQIGEPTAHKFDENGVLRPTYPTFKNIADGIWEYCGDCFQDRNC